DSVFLKIQWALDKFGMLDQFNTTVAPFRITHKGTGSTFYFYGSDDFQKLKSNDINDIIAVWIEEAAEFDSEEEFDQLNITFMRQKHHLADFVDRKSTRLNSSHVKISYAVFCLKKKITTLSTNENYP